MPQLKSLKDHYAIAAELSALLAGLETLTEDKRDDQRNVEKIAQAMQLLERLGLIHKTQWSVTLAQDLLTEVTADLQSSDIPALASPFLGVNKLRALYESSQQLLKKIIEALQVEVKLPK